MPVDRVCADPADQLHDDVAEPVGARSAQHLLLLVSVPAGRRESGELHFAGGVSRGRALPADRQLFSFITGAASNDAFYSDSQFIGYGFGNQTARTRSRVLQVYDDSPASEAGLSRGDRIVTVNGPSVASMVANGTIGARVRRRRGRPDDDDRMGHAVGRAPLGAHGQAPRHHSDRVADARGRGRRPQGRLHLFFRNFVQPSTAALTDAFAALKTAGATELVLDLRYNGGGLVDVAVHLASLIGGTAPTAR